MRVRTKVWIAIVAVCAALTVYEIPNAVRIGRFTWAIWVDRHTSGGNLNVPATVTDRLVAADPEAGDMLKYCLSADMGLEELGALVTRYPQNEFFLSEFAEGLTVAGVVDPRGTLPVFERLLELNGDNAHYRYMRGWMLLMGPDLPGGAQEALKQFELGHDLPQFYLPYGKYKGRLDRLCERAGLIWDRPDIRPFYMDLARRVFLPDGLRRRLGDGVFRELSASIVKIADRVIENAYDSDTLLAGAALLGPAERVKLKEPDLSEAEAELSRLRLAQATALMGVHGQSSFSVVPAAVNVVWMLTLSAFLIITAMVALLAIALEFLHTRLCRREPKVWTNIKACMLIDAVLVAILILLVAMTLMKKRPDGELPGFLVSMAAIFISWNAVGLYIIRPSSLARLRWPRLWVWALCGSLWIKGAVLWTAGRLSVSMHGDFNGWLQYGAVLLGWSVLCVLVSTDVAYRQDSFAAKHPKGIVLIMDWVVILMVFHIFGLVCEQMDRLSSDPLSRYRPLPRATQATYDRVILGQGLVASPSKKGSAVVLPGHFGFAAPKDVKTFIAKSRAAGQQVPDDRLRRLLRDCSRDVRPIILDALADPNAYDVLVTRAEWGDRSVREQLDRIFQERLTEYSEAEPEPPARGPSSLGELLQLAGVLARVSDGPERHGGFSYLLEQVVEKTQSLGTGRMLDDPRHAERIMEPFWESLSKVPDAEATELTKSYLRQTRFVDFFADRGRDIAHLTGLLANGDRELAEEVVAVLAGLPSVTEQPAISAGESMDQRDARLRRYRGKNSAVCLDAVFAHLGVESIPLLLEHLDSDNDQLRAFVVWRVTSLGYEWSEEQLAQLRQDKYWKVRLNALFACDIDDLTTSVEDENPLIRTVARLLVDAEVR